MSAVFWGVINEDNFSLCTPRAVDGDHHESLSGAVAEAARMIASGDVEQCSVVQCRYSKRNEVWVEVANVPSITISAQGDWSEADL